MNNYVVLLKGINVGGHHKIKMADLKQQLEDTGLLSKVTTYIQSGNITLSSALQPEEIVKTIQNCIESHYGFHIATIVISKDDWLTYSENHPYFDEAEELKMLHLTLLYQTPNADQLEPLLSFKPNNEHCKIIGKAMYLYYPDGFGRCKFTSALIERKLKCNTTSRNWRTVQKLRTMLLEMEE